MKLTTPATIPTHPSHRGRPPCRRVINEADASKTALINGVIPMKPSLGFTASTLCWVKAEASTDNEQIRAAEVIAACCLATDLGMGFPFEHGLHATLMAQRLAGLLGVDPETNSHTYCCCLLSYTGCTTDADIAIRIFGGNRTDNITPVQFGSSAQMLAGVVRALPPTDSPPLRRAYEVGRRLPRAARFLTGGHHFAALCDVA